MYLYTFGQFLQVDAVHLKGEWNGVVLVATAKDTNNTLVLVAFAICDKENASNYCFLLTEMKKNPHMAALLSSTGITIYSDEHQSISAALKAHASRCIHRLCLHHLIKNLPGPGIGSVRDLLFGILLLPLVYCTVILYVGTYLPNIGRLLEY